MRGLKEIQTLFSVIRILNMCYVSVDPLNFSGGDSDQVRKVGLKFRRQSKVGVPLGAAHTEMTAGDMECIRSHRRG